MNNWKRNDMSLRGGHGRSVSSVGYPVTSRQQNAYTITETPYSHGSFVNQHYASFVDISSVGDSGNDTRRHFSWRSPINYPESINNQEKLTYPIFQGPFESAFKGAINKMKEYSINRLGTVEKNVKSSKGTVNNFDNIYQRNYVTLPQNKITVEYNAHRPSHKVFKCNSLTDHDKDDDSFVSTFLVESTSETETEKKHKIKDQKSIIRKISLDTVEPQNVINFCPSSNIQKKNVSTVTSKLSSGAKIVISAKSSLEIEPPKNKISVVSETYISPKMIIKQQSSLPQAIQNYDEDYDSPKFEPLPSVQDIIAKVEALTNASDNKKTPKSNIHNIERSSLKKPCRSDSQKSVETYQSLQQCEQAYLPKKPMSGLYKNSNSPQLKRNLRDNVPLDFKKLHNAFLEQKQEIQNLKREIEEQKIYIVQLESDIRSYEPWR